MGSYWMICKIGDIGGSVVDQTDLFVGVCVDGFLCVVNLLSNGRRDFCLQWSCWTCDLFSVAWRLLYPVEDLFTSFSRYSDMCGWNWVHVSCRLPFTGILLVCTSLQNGINVFIRNLMCILGWYYGWYRVSIDYEPRVTLNLYQRKDDVWCRAERLYGKNLDMSDTQRCLLRILLIWGTVHGEVCVFTVRDSTHLQGFCLLMEFLDCWWCAFDFGEVRIFIFEYTFECPSYIAYHSIGKGTKNGIVHDRLFLCVQPPRGTCREQRFAE